jgi:hypothetical protein
MVSRSLSRVPMAKLKPIWEIARRDLVLDVGHGQTDVFLWEHAERVTRAAEGIADLPDVAGGRLDRAALTAASLYHDAGWALQYRDGLIQRSEILSRPTSDMQRELAAALLEDRLASVLTESSRSTAADCLRQINNRDTTLPEAQALAEADSLDQIGVQSFWQVVRRHSNEGKGIQAAVDTWCRQKEYHFWEARIADSFRFESVRQLARRRLAHFAEFMDELAREHRGDDIAQALAGIRFPDEQRVRSSAG